MASSALDPVTMVYHELRSPLGLVAMAARSVAEEATDETVRRRCETIVRSAERMLRMANQVFALTQVGREVESRPFSPSDLVLALAEDLAALGVPLRLRISPAARRAWVTGSPACFEALVNSLLTNALDHGRPGAPITLAMDVAGDRLVFELRNSTGGPTAHRGLGLGRLIARELAGQLGASIELAPEGESFVARASLPVEAGGSAE